ncbi:MAG: hypothetical protein HY264_04210, partial [Chloroflexi bacterium]|nr:hypothetical protein [Chloroflexota bacterium]
MFAITQLRLRLANEQIARDHRMAAEERLADCEVRSPMTGVLIQKNVDAGQIISSGVNAVSGGTVLGTVADLSKLYVEAS